MRLLHHFGSILLCLVVVSSQNKDAIKLNEIENNSKNAEDDITAEKDTERAASELSLSIKEIKPKEQLQEVNLAALSSTVQKSVIKQKNSRSSPKFGERSLKVKEEEKTEASHRGEQYLPSPNVPLLRTNPGPANTARAEVAPRNVAAYERYQEPIRQEQRRNGETSRHRPPNAKQLEYVEGTDFAAPAALHSDSVDYDDRRAVSRSNGQVLPQSRSRQAKAENFDASYDGGDDECSKIKSRSISSVSEEDESAAPRYPRQNSFRHRIQSTDEHPRYQEYEDDYSYRPQNANEARSYDSNEKTEEDEEFNVRERRPHDRDRRYYGRNLDERRTNHKTLPPQPVQRHHDQYPHEQVPQGKDADSVSRHKDSVSKSLTVSKSYSEPKKTDKIIFLQKPNPNKRGRIAYQSTPAYAEDPNRRVRVAYQSTPAHVENPNKRVRVAYQSTPPYVEDLDKRERVAYQSTPAAYVEDLDKRARVAYQSTPAAYVEDPNKRVRAAYQSTPAYGEDPNKRVRAAYQSTPAYVEDQLPYQEHRIQQANVPLSQNEPFRETFRGDRQNPGSNPRKPLLEHSHAHVAHEHPDVQQYDSRHPQTQYLNVNNRDHHALRSKYHHLHSVSNQQDPPPHHDQQHHYHPHPHAEHQQSNVRSQTEQPYVDHQDPSESQNQRQDLAHDSQHQYDQHAIHLQQPLRERRNQRGHQVQQNHRTNSPYLAEPQQARSSTVPTYNRDYSPHVNNKYFDQEVVQEPKAAAPPPKSLHQEDSAALQYQDPGTRQHASRSGQHGSPRLPQTGSEPKPYVSVSYSESSYKDGRLEQRYAPEGTLQPHYVEYDRQPEYYKPEAAPPAYAKTSIPEQYEEPINEPNVTPEKSHVAEPQYQHTQKAKNQDDRYPASGYSDDSNYEHQSGPPAVDYQQPRDEYESIPPQHEEPSRGVLPYSFLRNHPDISDKAKIIIAEPVPGKPNVLVADGARAIVAGNMRGKSSPHSTTTDSEYSASPEVSDNPVAANPERERNYGITQNIPGSFAALVNTDPKFLRKLPEMMHSFGRDQSNSAPDSEAYYSNPQEPASKEVGGGKNYETQIRATNVNNFDGSAHGLIQQHGEGVRSMMYHIRPNQKNHFKFSPSPEESRTSEQKKKSPRKE